MPLAFVLGVDSLSILFNHRSFQKPDPFSVGFRFSGKIWIPGLGMGNVPLDILGDPKIGPPVFEVRISWYSLLFFFFFCSLF